MKKNSLNPYLILILLFLTSATFAQVDAVDDTFYLNPCSSNFSAVFTNDTLDGSGITNPSDVSVTYDNTSAPFLSIDASGILVNSNPLIIGSFTLTYTLTSNLDGSSDSATIIVHFDPPVFDAVDDNFVTDASPGQYHNIFINDSFCGFTPLQLSYVQVSFPSGLPPGITVDQFGQLVVAPLTTPGSYSFPYELCDLNSLSCNSATVTVFINPTIDAVDDVVSVQNAATSNSILANDTIDGMPISPAQVLVSTPTPFPFDIVLNPNGSISVGPLTPAGTYNLQYQVCSILIPFSCDVATITLTVLPKLTLNMAGTYVDYNADGFTNVGDVIQYQFTVANPSGTPFSNVYVSDAVLSIAGTPIPTLAGGASDTSTFTASYVLTLADIMAGAVTNNATVTGLDLSSIPYSISTTTTTSLAITDAIKMNAFIDTNANGVQDAGELNFSDGQFHYEFNNNGIVQQVTNPSGTFIIYETNSANSYHLSYTINPAFTSVYLPLSVNYNNVHVLTGSGVTLYNFPITEAPFNDLKVVLTSYRGPVPGFVHTNIIRYENKGTSTIASGTVTFNHDANVTIAPVAGATPIANGFTFPFTNLLRNEVRYIYVTVNTPTIPTVALGDFVTNTASITLPPGDIHPSDNTAVLTQEIRGAYDPNDKTESHGGAIVAASFLANDYLEYTIRFENTGTGNAVNIRVDDVLSASYDASSLVMLGASAPYTLVATGNNLSWQFNGINLPPSVSPTSSVGKGFITFKVKLNGTVTPGFAVANQANIYFDTNPAIVTNNCITQFTSATNPCTTPIVPVFSVTSIVCHETTVSPLPAASTNGITGSWTPAWTAPAIGSIATPTYEFVPDPGQCLNSLATYFLTLPVTQNIPTFNQVAPICAGAVLQPLPTTSTNGITGTWSPALNNMATTTYTFTPDAGQCAFGVNMTISVVLNGPATTSYAVCEGETVVGGLLSSLSGTYTSSFSGDTTGAPTFHRPYSTSASDGTPFPTVNCTDAVMVGEATNYVTHNFTAPATGSYTFTTCGNAGWDTFLALYQAPFNPAGLCAGNTLVRSGDDSICGLETTMTANLVAGTPYILVVCGYSTPNFGPYTVTVTSPGVSNVEWYTTPSGGSPIATGSPFNPVGVSGSGIVDTNTVGVTSFYAQYPGESCRTQTFFEVTPMVMPLFNPIAPICIGNPSVVLPTISLNNITGTWSPAFDNTATTTYTFTPNTGQCATNYAMTVVVNPVVTNTTTLTVCDRYTWPVNGTLYTSSGTYTETLGCVSEELVLTITPLTVWYLDADNDGFGVTSTTISSCIQPTGYVSNSTDCDDANPSVHPGAIDICLDGIDNDCNGVIDNVGMPGGCVPVTTNVVNATCGSTINNLSVTIAANWISGTQEYRFRVKNLVTGAIIIIDRPINSFALVNAPGITLNTPYEIDVAIKINGVWQPFYGVPCQVTTPNPVCTIGAQCNTTLTSMTQFVNCNFVPSALGYRFKVTNTLTGVAVIYDSVNNKFNFSQITGSTFNTVYTVEVALQNTNGIYLPYNTGCNITTPPYPTTQLIPAQCAGFVVANGNQFINCNAVAGALLYQFRLFNGGTYTAPFVTNVNKFKLNNFTGLLPGTTYTVEVAVKMPNESNFGPYGNSCTIITPAVFKFAVPNNDMAFTAVAYPNPFTNAFYIDVKTASNTPIEVKVYDMLGRLLENQSVDHKELPVKEIGGDYPGGVYNIVLTQDDNQKTLRVIKK